MPRAFGVSPKLSKPHRTRAKPSYCPPAAASPMPCSNWLRWRSSRQGIWAGHSRFEGAAFGPGGRTGVEARLRELQGAVRARLPGYRRHAADRAPDSLIDLFDARCDRWIRRDLVDAPVCAVSARARAHQGRHPVDRCARSHHRRVGLIGACRAMAGERSQSAKAGAAEFFRPAHRHRLRRHHDQGQADHPGPQRQRFFGFHFRRAARCHRNHHLDRR